MMQCIECGKPVDDELQFGRHIVCPACGMQICTNYPEHILLKDGKAMFEVY
jgi:predicted RNA-binding Zn-ribbon protein involved in translation (DUF1610 family)